MAKTQQKNSKPKKSSQPGKSRGRSKGKAAGSQPRIQLTLDQKIDILGIFLIGLGGLTLLSMISSQQGEMPRQWIGFLRDTFGLGFIVVPIVLLLLGLWLVLRKFEKTPRLTREQIAGLIVLFVIALISMAFIDRVGRRDDRHGAPRRVDGRARADRLSGAAGRRVADRDRAAV